MKSHNVGNLNIHESVKIGKFTVIGEDGFNFERDKESKLHFNEHTKGVIIEKDVWLGSQVSVDRGRYRDTIIGEGTKVDDHVHIAHNVHIGKNCLIGPCACILGSVDIGDGAEIWSNCTIHQWVKVGNNSVVGAGTYLRKNVPDNHVAYMKGDTLIIKPKSECKKYNEKKRGGVSGKKTSKKIKVFGNRNE